MPSGTDKAIGIGFILQQVQIPQENETYHTLNKKIVLMQDSPAKNCA